MDELPIKRLGPFLIDGVLGKGAMGLVFSAQHQQTKERAAIKVLAPQIASDEKFRERFAAEIESLKTLHHPNIVKLFGFGEYEGHSFYAMELVEGTNLEQELAAGRRFNWRDVTEIAISVARALKHAHDHGVIHRDLKPANLLIDREDRVKLTDFGIAKLFGSTDVTLGGNVIGTVDYMAPEQAAGESTSPRSDLYSLGCVMYALLCGRPPFRGKSIPEVLHKVRYEQHQPISQYAADVPADLCRIIDELLEKDPEARIRTALSLSHRLRAIQQALSISTTTADEFSSDDDTNSWKTSSPTSLIVNPPPDIAERPTVFLPEDEQPPARPATSSPAEVRELADLRKDHFTRFDRDSKSRADFSRGSDFSSAIPLLLLLLVVLGGLLGGIWYSSQPLLSADDLHARIIDDSDKLDSKLLERDVERFLKHHADDPRVDRIKDLQEEIEIKKLQRVFEIRARAKPETGSLSPIEIHCNDAFRRYRQGELEEAIAILDGIMKLFSSESDRGDIRILRALELVHRLKPQWEEELATKILGLEANLRLRHERALELVEENPQQAREFWEGILVLYDQPWAQEYFDAAQQGLADLDARETPNVQENREQEE